jgi:FO synthase
MTISVSKITNNVIKGHKINNDEALALATCDDLELLTEAASIIRDQGHGDIITYSPKVIVPFTSFCDAQWDYCAVANPAHHDKNIYLSQSEILAIAQRGREMECVEILFFLAAKPEQFSSAARAELQQLGFESTLDYLAAMAKLVFEETGLLPKLHSGVLNRDELSKLRKVSLAQGLMLDSRIEYLSDDEGNSYGSTNQHPYVRLGVAAAAGAINVPFTSGIIIGIGESRRERIDALLGLRYLSETYDHLQEVVIQHYRSDAEIKNNLISKSLLKELLWTVAVARIMFGANANIQAPADLPSPALEMLLQAGINDWGSVTPAPISLIGSTTPWPQLQRITTATNKLNKTLRIRLPLYPAFIKDCERWLDNRFVNTISTLTDKHGLALRDST